MTHLVNTKKVVTRESMTTRNVLIRSLHGRTMKWDLQEKIRLMSRDKLLKSSKQLKN